METKQCPKCAKHLPLTEFRICSNGRIKRVSSYCNRCAVAHTKELRRIKTEERKLQGIPSLDGETWHEFNVDGYGSNYLVSNYSRIKSKYRQVVCGDKIISVFEKILKTSNLKGYRAVELTNDQGESKKILTHRIIAITFIPNPSNKSCVNHKNGNKSDNRIDNLEWCTLSENTIHAWHDIKTMKPYMAGEKRILQKSLDGQPIKIWDSASKAAKGLKLSQGSISMVARGERNKCGNYKWQYVN